MSAGMASSEGPVGPHVSLLGRAALVMGSSFNGIGIFTIGVPLPAMRNAFAGAAEVATLIPLIAAIGGPAFALASPLFGRLAGRLGYRTVYLLGILLYEIGGLAPVVLDDLWLILLSRLVIALGVSASLAASLAGIATLPADKRPGMFGLLNLMGSVTIAAAFPVIGLLVKSGWQYSFLIHLMLLPVLLLVLALPQTRPSPAEPRADAQRGSILAGLDPALVIAIAIVGLTMSAGSFYGPTYMADAGITDPAESGLSLSLMSVTAMVASALFGRMHKHLGTTVTLAIGLLLFASGAALIGLSSSWLPITVGFCFSGAAATVYISALYTSVTEHLGDRAAPALGTANLALYGSQIFFPLLASQVAVRFGGSVLYFTVAGAILLAALPMSLRSVHRPSGAAEALA